MSYTLVETSFEVREPIPDGTVVDAELVEVGERDGRFWIDKDDHSKGKQREINWKFRITEDGPFFDRFVWGNTPTWFDNHPACKFRIWTQELLGYDELPLGFELDIEDLPGQPCRIRVKLWESNGKSGNEVSDVLRATEDSYIDEDPF